MIYVIINFVLAVYLIWTSLNVNTKNINNENTLINISLLLSGATIIMTVTVCCVLWGPERFTVFLEHLLLFLVGTMFVAVGFYFLSFIYQKRNAFVNILEAIFVASVAYVSFGKIRIEDYTRLEISADQVFSGLLQSYFPIDWVHVYAGFFIFIFPAFCLMLMLFNAENSDSRQAVQRSFFYGGSMFLGWIGLYLLQITSDMLPMIRTLYLVMPALMCSALIKTAATEKIYDVPTILSSVFSMGLQYALPAVVVSVVYVSLRPIYYTSHIAYILVVGIITILVIELSTLLSTSLKKWSNFRSAQYGVDFEADLANIDYDAETKEICDSLFKIFRDRASVSDMTILIESSNGEFETSYSSNDTKITVSAADDVFDVLNNNNISIVFRDDITSNYMLAAHAAEFNSLFAQSDAECLIVLHEGRHIMGLLFLGEKKSGSAYDEYDRIIFNRLYSYFFVFGYYMSNIANASVVGTVNREIRMSSQIITSIQENMDKIECNKVDLGYLMIPAHNIGGEFIDLIRLTDKRHIVVVGSLSGKGISASMSMVILKSIIRTFLSDTHDFKKLVSKVNNFIRFNLPKGTFFAGIFCLLDFESDTMYYINCGIPTMLMYTKSFNNVIEIQGSGYVLGFVKDISPLIKVKQMKLNTGDVIAISTSGLINSHSLRGEQFGKDRIKQSITDNYMYEASRMVNFTYDSLQKFMAKELDDDITLLMIRYLDAGNQLVTDENLEGIDDTLDESILAEAEAGISEAAVSEIAENGEAAFGEVEAGEPQVSVEEPLIEEPVIDEPIVGEPVNGEAVPDFTATEGVSPEEAGQLFSESDVEGFDEPMFKDEISDGEKPSDSESADEFGIDFELPEDFDLGK